MKSGRESGGADDMMTHTTVALNAIAEYADKLREVVIDE